MGVAQEQRFARLNRERFETDLMETVTILESTWSRNKLEKMRQKERADAAEQRIAELERDLNRARRAIKVLESSRTMEREQRARDDDAAAQDHAFRCSLMESTRDCANRHALRANQAMAVIKYAMPPEEYHQIMAILFSDDSPGDAVPPNA